MSRNWLSAKSAPRRGSAMSARKTMSAAWISRAGTDSDAGEGSEDHECE
jgi:hypothetical protein